MRQTFLLPTPPSTNNLFVNLPGKGRIKTSAYRGWINEAGWCLLKAKPRLIQGLVHLEIVAGKSDNRRRDLDNLVKATSDLLVTHGVIEDDSKIWKLTSLWSRQITGLVVNVESFNEQGVKAA